MTEEVTATAAPAINLDTYTGRELGLSFYSFKKGDPKEREYQAVRKDIEDKLAKGEPVYVTFSDERREHSVGRIKSVDFSYSERQHRSYYSQGAGDTYCYASLENIVVVWDGRSNKVKPQPGEITYWPDWNQGTQWYWEQNVRPKVEPIIAYDHLGQQLEVGQNVCFVHRSYGQASMHFGTVTRFTKMGTVFVKTMKLKDGDYRAGSELKANSMEDVVIVNDALMKRLVMAKLAAN